MTVRVARLHDRRDLRLETDADPPAPGPGEARVRVGVGGICGSDLHYYHDGGFGSVQVREPIILGHEIAGTVEALGPDLATPAPGTLVAVNPSQPCGACRFCRAGATTHCLDMQFMGSAMRLPHAQGGFRDVVVVPAARLAAMSPGTGPAAAACVEPLAVALHGAARAGELAGRRVLVTGAGPIGALCTAAARRGGAAEVTVTDLHTGPLAVAEAMGATGVVDLSAAADGLAPYEAEKGYFDLAFECSAAGPAIAGAFGAVRPLGRIVQVGLSGEVGVPLNALVSKEIEWLGTQRFQTEFAEAARAIDTGAIDVGPIITHSFGLDDLDRAFETAGDRRVAVKAQIDFAR